MRQAVYRYPNYPNEQKVLEDVSGQIFNPYNANILVKDFVMATVTLHQQLELYF